MPGPGTPAGARPYTRDCGRAGRAFGWFLAVAVAFLFALLYREGGGPAAVVLALGAAGAIGAGLALWQWGVRLEDGGAKVTSWSGPGVAFFRSSWPREAVTGVRLDKEVAVTGKGTFVHYLVRVTRHGGLGDLYRRRHRDGHALRLEAEAIAKLLRADLRDESGAEPAVRDAAHLDEPLVARMRRLGITPAQPAQAENAVARVRHEADGAIVVEIPPFGFRAKLLLPIVLVAAVVAITLGLEVATSGTGGGGIPWQLLGFLLLLVVGAPALMLLANAIGVATRRETIAVSRAGIEVRVSSLTRTRTSRIAAAAIEEIVAPMPLPGLDDTNVDLLQVYGIAHPATQVLVRTDAGDTPLGRSLPLGERRWLRDMLVHALAATADGASTAITARSDAGAAARSSSGAAGASGRIARRALVAFAAAGIAIAFIEVAGVRHRMGIPGGATVEPTVDYSRYELKPGPGSGFLRMYGRGVHAAMDGRDLRLAIDEVLLIATHRSSATGFRDLSVSVHRRVGTGWALVGHAGTKRAGPGIGPGSAFLLPGPLEFVVAGAAETCMREPCSFRLHVVGQVGTERPGWDVTDMAPLALRP